MTAEILHLNPSSRGGVEGHALDLQSRCTDRWTIRVRRAGMGEQTCGASAGMTRQPFALAGIKPGPRETPSVLGLTLGELAAVYALLIERKKARG